MDLFLAVLRAIAQEMVATPPAKRLIDRSITLLICWALCAFFSIVGAIWLIFAGYLGLLQFVSPLDGSVILALILFFLAGLALIIASRALNRERTVVSTPPASPIAALVASVASLVKERSGGRMRGSPTLVIGALAAGIVFGVVMGAKRPPDR